MKKIATRSFGLLATLIMIITMLSVPASAAEVAPSIQPRYTGISTLLASLDISSTGKASCYGYVEPYSGYSVNLTVELQRDGDTIKTWTGSGSSDFSIDKIYYVTPNHDYQVVVTANIHNANGVLVGTPSVKSTVQSY